MTRQEMWKEFIVAVERRDRPVSVREIAGELYGGEPDVQQRSAVTIAEECKQAGLLRVSLGYQDLRATPQGLAFIGKVT